MMEKRCNACGEVKDASQFSKRKTATDGLQNRCKSCYSAYKKEYRLRKGDELRAKHRAYKKKHREKDNEHGRKRRARKKGVNEKFTAEDAIFCLERADWKCEQCGMTNDDHLIRYGHRLHLDHIKPLREGYALTRENCQVLCQHCNCSKH